LSLPSVKLGLLAIPREAVVTAREGPRARCNSVSFDLYGDDQITFILAILIIYHHDPFPHV